jgi:hypothetical protein
LTRPIAGTGWSTLLFAGSRETPVADWNAHVREALAAPSRSPVIQRSGDPAFRRSAARLWQLLYEFKYLQ